MTHEWKHPKHHAKIRKDFREEIEKEKNMIREYTMKKYKVRLVGMGIEAVAIIPFDTEPTKEKLENNVAYYLNNNLMKVEHDENFYAKDRYTITYEEVNI